MQPVESADCTPVREWIRGRRAKTVHEKLRQLRSKTPLVGGCGAGGVQGGGLPAAGGGGGFGLGGGGSTVTPPALDPRVLDLKRRFE